MISVGAQTISTNVLLFQVDDGQHPIGSIVSILIGLLGLVLHVCDPVLSYKVFYLVAKISCSSSC